MTDYVDGIPKSEIEDFRKNTRKVSSNFTPSRTCDYCGKDLTNETSKYTTDITKRVGFKKYETKTIEYCRTCKSERNL